MNIIEAAKRASKTFSTPLLLMLMMTFALTLTGCQGQAPKTAVEKPPASSEAAAPATGTESSLTLTLEELKAYDGQNGQPAYIAIDGTIYDVSAVEPWKTGLHQGKYKAGNDLTEEIKKSPHGKGVLKQAVVVGTLK